MCYGYVLYGLTILAQHPLTLAEHESLDAGDSYLD